eukprot:TRINITY_DN15162_c0_g1_i1.p1 TRINITY_DN15162_c0_g1~~TRINITY_DN15162_c0_g1_i1.p1  ORF type:complete len:122 (+),score=32.96 TRINITY_DN15162_c0_g1_i1:335-700(+)
MPCAPLMRCRQQRQRRYLQPTQLMASDLRRKGANCGIATVSQAVSEVTAGSGVTGKAAAAAAAAPRKARKRQRCWQLQLAVRKAEFNLVAMLTPAKSTVSKVTPEYTLAAAAAAIEEAAAA